MTRDVVSKFLASCALLRYSIEQPRDPTGPGLCQTGA